MAITVNQPTTEDTQTELSTGRSRERDETQQMIDGIVGEIKAVWDKAGNPEPGNSNPFNRLAVAKADVSALKGMIRRAATLHKVVPVYWKDAKNEDGTVTVKFGVSAMPAKATANGTTGTPAPTAETTESALADAENQQAEAQAEHNAAAETESAGSRRSRFGNR